MERIIQSLINNWMRGADTYTHNGSTWLIFTDSKKWVVELTKEKTLWYNYNFFKQIFEFTSLDVVENQQYITKWVEDNIVNKVTEIKIDEFNTSQFLCEDVIENGVKNTLSFEKVADYRIEDTIQNGVKKTQGTPNWTHDPKISNVINNGIKETKTPGKDGDILSTIEWMDENNSNSYTKMIDDVIDNGVKETNSWNDSIIGDLNQNGLIDAVIKEGIKETKHANKYNSIGPIIKEGKINDIIENGVRVSGTFVGGTRQKENVESVIGYGIKNPTD